MYDIAIIGGGMAGAGLVCALAGEKAGIALVEERPARDDHPHSDDARGMALSLSSRKILDETGLWPKLETSACPIEHIHVSTLGRFGCVRMSAGMLAQDALGYVVPAHELGRALYREITGKDNIDIFCPATAEGIETESGSVAVRIRPAGGETVIRCRLLVIAEGAFSNLRDKAGIKTRVHDYRQSAIVSNISVSRDHRNTAYERFVPGGLVAMLPLNGGLRCVSVLVSPSEESDRYMQLDDEGYLKLVQQAFGKRLGQLSGPGPRQSYPLFLLQPERQVAGRIVLLGNAAHTVHPNGAQGLNLALRDVAALAGLLRPVLENGGDAGAPDVLAAYTTLREADQRQVVRFTDMVQRTSGAANPLKSALRGSMMLALDTLPGMKKEFISRATGLRTPPPKHMPDFRGLGKAGAPLKADTGRSPAGGGSGASRAPDTELLITGGGVIGSTMALLAASAGIDCILVERNRRPATEARTEDARMLALTPASGKILTRVQAWQQLAEQDIGLFRQMHVWDENGSGSLFFDSADIGLPALGHIVPQNLLVGALESARAGLHGISVHAGAEPAHLSDAGNAISVTLSDGREVSAKLLVAADGTGSKVRQLAGIGYPVHQYRQTAVAGIVRTELNHGQVARQRFLSDGPLAFLPMTDPNHCGVVWSTAPGHADDLLAMDEAAFQQALGEAFEHTLGAVTGVGARQCFPLQRAQARRYCSDRIALVGDAAHCVHPLAGLGANLGLLDVAALFQIINTAGRKGRDPGGAALLRKYERWRKGENYMVMMTLEGLKYLFENQTLPIPGLRNAGMELFNSFQALKNFTMRRATGLAGDLPDLVNGN